MKVAIVGSGISGLVAAWTLAPRHEVTLFESDVRLGGHTHTVATCLGDRRIDVDTGFIVFNERTYPNFIRLLAELGVESESTGMSFGFRNESTGLEYSGSGLAGFFAQPQNALRPRHWRLLRDILRFQREAPGLLDEGDDKIDLGGWLETRGYGAPFVEDHLLPMGGAIWSCSRDRLRRFPARSFVRFFFNHGLLQLRDRPRWRTIRGGSRRYVDAMMKRLGDRVRVGVPITALERRDEGIWLRSGARRLGPFDRAVVATHSDQALALLEAPTEAERRILSAIRYQENEAILHTDPRLLPRSPRARAAWNYHRLEGAEERPAVTYWMNALQSLETDETVCVTLNRPDAIDPRRILRRITYHHPLFDQGALEAQSLRSVISGRDRVHYCGAYWRYGFHEDGVVSAIRAVEELERVE